MRGTTKSHLLGVWKYKNGRPVDENNNRNWKIDTSNIKFANAPSKPEPLYCMWRKNPNWMKRWIFDHFKNVTLSCKIHLNKVLFHFFVLSYESDYIRRTAVQFFFQQCYQIISPILISFKAKHGFFEEKLATFSWFSLVKLHPHAVKKRRREYISGSKTGLKSAKKPD